MSFGAHFRGATGLGPLPWQRDVAATGPPEVLSVPTGLGKTEGTVPAWSWRRQNHIESTEPRHLIYIPPMRVLVRQTAYRRRRSFERLQRSGFGHEVPVFRLIGGDADEDWERLREFHVIAEVVGVVGVRP